MHGTVSIPPAPVLAQAGNAPVGKKRALPRLVKDYIKRIYFDRNNAETSDIVHAMSKVGDDHLLTGTDFPWLDDSLTRQILGELDPAVRSKIAYVNAAKLFRHVPTLSITQ